MTRPIAVALALLAAPAGVHAQTEERPTPNTVRAEPGSAPPAATLADVREAAFDLKRVR